MKHLFFYALALLFMVACQTKQNNSGNSKGGAVNTELPSLAYTIYTQKTELFAEFRTPVSGDTLKLGGHFTKLGEYFTALTEGTVTLTLMVGETSVSNTATVSSSPGIYRFAVVPTKSGIGKMVFEIKNPIYTDQIVIENVMVYADVKTAMDSPKEEQKGNTISYLKEQAWKVEFANIAVVPHSFNEIIKTTGEILPAQGDEMVVTANANGIVTFTGNRAVVGTAVRTGETLFTISGKNLTDGNTETRFTQVKVAYEKAKADYDRARELVKDNIVSQKDFLETKARYETASQVGKKLYHLFQDL